MESKTTLTVRYAETDQMGVVHHSNYPIWFEAGRTDLLKQMKLSYTSIEAKGVLLPLYEMNCKFISSARYEDEVTVATQVKKLSPVRAVFSYQVINALSGRLIATGETMHAWTDRALKPINAKKAMPEIYDLLTENNSDLL